MVESAQSRRRGALDFESYYADSCAVQGSCPVAAVKVHLSQGMLDFNGDHVHLTDWTPILNALSINKQLHHVAIKSTHLSTLGAQGAVRWSGRRKTPALHSRSVTLALCRAVQKCLCVSECLHTLQLHGLPLRERDLTALTKGLVKSPSLEHLSLAQCPIADQGLEIICQSVKYSSSIKSLDFSCCNVTWQGAEHLANIIKHQAVRRHGTAWAESLRYRKAEFEGMSGLRRITLNGNILIGDQGAAALAQELAEDLWVKAVDLQKCGLSDEGARSLLHALQSNQCLHVMDIRSNPLVECSLVKDIITRVLMNTKGQDSQYMWIKPQAMREAQKVRVGKRSSTGKIRRGSSKASQVSVGSSRPVSGGIPWRTAARAGKKRGATSATPEYSFQGAASVKVTLETESETDPEESQSDSQSSVALSGQEQISSSQYNRLKVELEECRLRLTEERNARLRTNSRLVELELENAGLRSMNSSLSEMVENPGSSALLDDTVLDSIESSFSKFNAFLNLLSEAGLGQLASMVGIDQSDFSMMGRPQLSSTGRGIEGGAGDLEAISMKPMDPGAPGSPRSLPSCSPPLEPHPGPSRLAAAPAGVGVEVHAERYLSSPAPDMVRSQQSTPRSVGSLSDGSANVKRVRDDGSRASNSHSNGIRDSGSHGSSSHRSGPKGRASRSSSSHISPRNNDSSDSSGHADVLRQYSSHSNGSHGNGSKGLYARHAEGDGGAAQLLESLSLSS
ncbi:centrosomal protein of 78 kDa isoform X2 [Sardina pilchardus]|uniref:centrosomal protein of 78 kDa isoform X2 n=1 Tax=Sardina pilchardus TaxID=27697 RepID=UPI002E0DB515